MKPLAKAETVKENQMQLLFLPAISGSDLSGHLGFGESEEVSYCPRVCAEYDQDFCNRFWLHLAFLFSLRHSNKLFSRNF